MTAVAAQETSPNQEAPSSSSKLVIHGDDATGSIAAFSSHANFQAAARMANALAQSTVVPAAYQGSPANCLVAMELASRTGASVMMVMQNLYVIKGKPSWSGVFLIACVNSCGRFSPLRYEMVGTPGQPGSKCRAVAKELSSGETLEGEWVTWEMAKGEGWVDKNDSKWKTMPGQMFRYRAASFWVKTYAPEISIGMPTGDEMEDIPAAGRQSPATASLNAALDEPRAAATTVDAEIAEETTAAEPAKAVTLVKGVECGECGAKKGQPHTDACPLNDD